MIVGSYSGFGTHSDPNGAAITLNVTETLFDLPVVGGKAALGRAGLEKVTPADVITTSLGEPESEVSTSDLTGRLALRRPRTLEPGTTGRSAVDDVLRLERTKRGPRRCAG